MNSDKPRSAQKLVRLVTELSGEAKCLTSKPKPGDVFTGICIIESAASVVAALDRLTEAVDRENLSVEEIRQSLTAELVARTDEIMRENRSEAVRDGSEDECPE